MHWPTLSTAVIGLLSLATKAWSAEVVLNQDAAYRHQCAGMYSRKSWGGSVDPYILAEISKPASNDIPEDKDPIVSIVIFEWQDEQLLGAPVSADSGAHKYICDPGAVSDNLCTAAEEGQVLLSPKANSSRSQIKTTALHLKENSMLRYPVLRTGYYCVSTYAYTDDDYAGVVEFRNAYGELPAAQIAKLPFHGALVIVYALMTFAWAFLYYTNRSDILPVQNYITAILIFLIVETFMTWLFYDFQNRHGLNAGAKALLVIVSVLSAGRTSFSFFLLLIVCMGYGVVKESLGKTMHVVRALAGVHFVFGVIYAVASLTVTPESAGPLLLFVVLPLAGTLTAFYIWTLNSLNYTLRDLVQRKQTSKAGMYRRLWWCILASIIVIFAFFFINSWTYADVSNADFVPLHWASRWFVLDGWLNLVYLSDVAYISWLWRPTANNKRFAMSQELAQDDEGFEIASMRDSLDGELEDGLEGENRKPDDGPPSYEAVNRHDGASSPLPAPVPQKPAALSRESIEGETIFAVGDEADRFSDDDDDGHDEHGKLTRPV